MGFDSAKRAVAAVLPNAASLKRVLAREDVLEAMCRAHDAEEAAQKGEPSLWAVHDRGDWSGSENEWRDFKDERLTAMRCALQAVGLADSSDGVPRDERGRDAHQIIADSNRAAADLRAGIKDRSREPGLGPPVDMAISRILLAECAAMDRKMADGLAVKIADAIAELKGKGGQP